MCGEEQGQAYRYLANYHVKRGQLDDAYTAALKCTEFTEVGQGHVTHCGRSDLQGHFDLCHATSSVFQVYKLH